MFNLPWVEAIKARVEKATPGPWDVDPETGLDSAWVFIPRGAANDGRSPDLLPVDLPVNADFIAHAREDIPRLLRAVEVLGEAVEKIAARPCVFAGTKSECSKASDGILCAYCAARRALADVREG